MTTATATLTNLIAEERTLFHRDIDGDDDQEHVDRIHALRRLIVSFPCTSMEDVVAKALWTERLFADTDESLDNVIAAAGYDDHAMGLMITRDLLRLQGYERVASLLSSAPATALDVIN